LCDGETLVLRPIQKQIISEKTLIEEYGIHPKNFALARAVVGDKSDNLPGVGGIGLPTIKKRFPFLSEDKGYDIESIVSYCKKKNLSCDLDVEDIKVHFGYGIEGLVDDKKVYIGSKRFMERLGINISEKEIEILKNAEVEGKIPVFVAVDKELKGLILFGQKIKKEAPKAIEALRKLGIDVAVLTGDTKYFADVIKRKLNISEVYAELLPEDKVKIIDETKKKGITVGMVGDGINDAPALAKADIGIALGCGTDLTRESANVSLLSDDLRKVPLAVILAKKVKKVIYTNMFWAFIYNVIGIGLAVMGKLNPIFSALAMILSSAFVIANSLRVKNW